MNNNNINSIEEHLISTRDISNLNYKYNYMCVCNICFFSGMIIFLLIYFFS